MYVVEEQVILITCIAHQHRKPSCYPDRRVCPLFLEAALNVTGKVSDLSILNYI